MYKIFITSCVAIGLFILAVVIIFGLFVLMNFIESLTIVKNLKKYLSSKVKLKIDWETIGFPLCCIVIFFYVAVIFYGFASILIR